MKKFFKRLEEKLVRFMYGRYGNDELTNFLLISCVVIIILGYIPYLQFFSLLAFCLLIFSLYRSFSKNLQKRRTELEKYLKIKKKLKTKGRLYRNIWRERKTHCYFKCKICKSVLRVPKKKGKIEVSCPKCKAINIKNT